jgi:hypothetical protein
MCGSCSGNTSASMVIAVFVRAAILKFGISEQLLAETRRTKQKKQQVNTELTCV